MFTKTISAGSAIAASMGTSGASGITSSTTEDDSDVLLFSLLCRTNVKFVAVKCLSSVVRNLLGVCETSFLAIESR